MNHRFSTLLLREWMQHQRGWLVTLLLPPTIFLALLGVGSAEGNPDTSALGMALIFVMATVGTLLTITWLSAMFQLPGLVRRDNQDRSVEFWLSLPASHSESIAAPLLAHAVLMPLAAVLVGYLFGGLISLGLVIKMSGWAAAAAMPWISVMGLSLPLVLRVLFGVVLLSLWLAPLLLLVLVASAWLKRFGMPAVVLGIGMSGLLLDKFYGLPIVWRLLQAQQDGALKAMLADPERLHTQLAALDEGSTQAFHAAAWALQDSLSAVQQLASPHFIGGLLVAGGCFALLVLKRSRSV